MSRQTERDEVIKAYHIAEDRGGLKCPLCGRWSPVAFDSPQGIRLDCAYRDCGVVAVMPRVPLARAIRRRA